MKRDGAVDLMNQNNQKNKVAVLGAGSWGTALAALLAKKGLLVRLWGRVEDGVLDVEQNRENRLFLPGIRLPDSLEATDRMERALDGVEAVVLSVPAQAVRGVIRQYRSQLAALSTSAMIINTAKGIETTSLMRLSEVIKQELPSDFEKRVAVLSGPSHAEEVSQSLPTAIVAAAESQDLAERVQDLFMHPRFRVYINPDLIGVELGGSLKNVIALSTGISDGMGYGDNTRAALMTRGLTEITRLGIAMGAQPLTFSGLSGVGDLIVTCSSMHSRNRRAGILLGQGYSLPEVLSEIGMVVEGVETAKAAYHLAAKLQVEMPITQQIFQVLFEGLSPQAAVNNLMLRQRKNEIEEVAQSGWNGRD